MRQSKQPIIIKQIEQRCEICHKEALFMCGKCESSHYCSSEHQKKHWGAHKQSCLIMQRASGSSSIDQLIKRKLQIKKCFYQNYSSKHFESCVLDAKVLIHLERQSLVMVKNDFAEFDYGAAHCLNAKIMLIVGDKKNAGLELQSYLREKKQFLSDLSRVVVGKKEKEQLIKQSEKQYIQRKVNLLSTLGNLCYALQLNFFEYYVLYIKHIERAFGAQSLDVSNCYFLLGCLLVQSGFFNRAIACFIRSAKIRGIYAGDCYFNIGVLYKMQNQLSKALQMFQLALKLREEQYGQDAEEIAQVFENMGNIYLQLNDFKTSFNQYEKAFKIRSNNPYSAQYLNIIDQIQELYAKLNLYIQAGQPDCKKPQIFTHLQSVIRQEKLYWPSERDSKQKNEKSFQQVSENMKMSRKQQKQRDDKKKQNIIQQIKRPISIAENLVKITQGLLQNLSPIELFRLSQLQIELENTKTQFQVVYIVANSVFLKVLSKQNYEMLIQQNQRLFELINLEEIQNKAN